MRRWIAGLSLVLLVACEGSRATGGSVGASGATSATTGGSGGGDATGVTTGGSGGDATAGSGGSTSAVTVGAGGASGSTSASTTGTGGVPAPIWGADQCPAAPPGVSVGVEVGQQLADIVLKDCDGNDVSLTELCGASALWIFAASATCPFCKSVSSQQEMIHAGYVARNLASVNILVENGQGDPPDANDCKVWRAKFGQQKVRTYFDPTGAVLALWPQPGTTSMSAFVDDERVIVSKLIHTADLVQIIAGIEASLEP